MFLKGWNVQMNIKKIIKCLTPYGFIILSRRIKSRIPINLEFSTIENDVKGDYLHCITITKNNETNETLEIIREDVKHPIYVRNNSSDVYVYKNVFEEYEYNFTVKSDPKYIIDAGANIGIVTIFFANKYKNAIIIAIEPEDKNYELLVKNTKNYSNVTTIKAALWNTCGEISLFESNSNYGFQVGLNKPDGKEVKQLTKAITISEIMDEFNMDSIDILKIDIEGSEKKVFESCKNWIEKTKCIIVELHERIKKGCNKEFFRNVKIFDKFGCRNDNLFLSKNNYIKML